MLYGALRRMPVYIQHDEADCGPSCLRMISGYYGKRVSLRQIRNLCDIGRVGASLRSLCRAAEALGFRTLPAKVTADRLASLPTPFIAHWEQSHFVVFRGTSGRDVVLHDPAVGRIHYPRDEFIAKWKCEEDANGLARGVVLMLQPTPAFTRTEDEDTGETEAEQAEHRFSVLWSYVWRYRVAMGHVLFAMVFSAVVGLLFPFLMQAVVDVGIGYGDITFVYLVLFAQLALFAGQAALSFFRGRLLLHVGNRVNIAVLSDLIAKLLRLPMSYFGTRRLADILQRVEDHRRIEQFLTSATLNLLLSGLTLSVLAFVLVLYDVVLFATFVVGSFASAGWVLLFAARRRTLDYRRFSEASKAQNGLIEIVTGLEEIKVNDCETDRRWTWERAQIRLFKLNLATLDLEQAQRIGADVLTELKHIVVSFLAAKAVIDGEMSLGMMVAVQYIIGQMSTPIRDMLDFVRKYQDAKFGWERSKELHETPDEEVPALSRLTSLPPQRSITLESVSFKYPGPEGTWVLRDLDLEIPAGKVTAIVGASGSGKTTLLKLLLKLYSPTRGRIRVGSAPLDQIAASTWRRSCGAVRQDGYLFADTIARNIALREEEPDLARLVDVADMANILAFVEGKALGWDTRLGAGGGDLSQGQKQRILIARALYPDPEYLLFDEATSSLDATNEREIMDKLGAIFQGRTVVVVAHRLSTVRNADQIVVLDSGRIVERGTHDVLVEQRGAYFHLVRNQLELGQ